MDINYPYYFQVIYAINFLCIAAWFAVPYVKVLITEITGEKAEAIGEETPYHRPKIDLALISSCGDDGVYGVSVAAIYTYSGNSGLSADSVADRPDNPDGSGGEEFPEVWPGFSSADAF